MKPPPRGTGCVNCARPDQWGASSGLRAGRPYPGSSNTFPMDLDAYESHVLRISELESKIEEDGIYTLALISETVSSFSCPVFLQGTCTPLTSRPCWAHTSRAVTTTTSRSVSMIHPDLNCTLLHRIAAGFTSTGIPTVFGVFSATSTLRVGVASIATLAGCLRFAPALSGSCPSTREFPTAFLHAVGRPSALGLWW
jgi:hypothetical protein